MVERGAGSSGPAPAILVLFSTRAYRRTVLADQNSSLSLRETILAQGPSLSILKHVEPKQIPVLPACRLHLTGFLGELSNGTAE